MKLKQWDLHFTPLFFQTSFPYISVVFMVSYRVLRSSGLISKVPGAKFRVKPHTVTDFQCSSEAYILVSRHSSKPLAQSFLVQIL